MMLVQGGRSGVWRRLSAQNQFFSSLRETLKLNVDGHQYTLSREFICKHPGSYFETAINKRRRNNDAFVHIARNSTMFTYVYDFLVTGTIPRNSSGQIDLDQETLKILKKEADFYKLTSLKAECDSEIAFLNGQITTVVGFSTPVVSTMSQVWCPLVIQGNVRGRPNARLFRNNSLATVCVDDLIYAAKKVQPNGLGPYRIDAFLLSETVLQQIGETIDVSSLFPEQQVKLKAKELLIRTPDSKEGAAGDNAEPRVGTVEVILNSAYTGGELHVMCDGQTTTVKTDPYSWVAVQTDAAGSVSPVTSGARVSLIFDVIALTERSQSPPYMQGELEIGYSKNELLDGVNADNFNMNRLIEVAQRLQPPPQVHSSLLRMDPYFLNKRTLEKLANLTEVSTMFPGKTLDIRPVDVVIQSKGLDTYSYERKDTGEGYLGTLVVAVGSYFTGGDVRLQRESEPVTTIASRRMSWYAYDANTTLQLCPITYGTRVTVHYDIYSTGDVVTAHDPLAGNDLTTLTHTTVSPTLREQVRAAVNAELLNTDAVIITLQDMYPEDVRTEDLSGGDRALCDVLSHSADASGWNEVELVKVCLQFQYDNDLRRNVLHSSTYTQTWGSDSDGNRTKLIIPTFLSEKPGAWRYEDRNRVHHITAIRVNKRK